MSDDLDAVADAAILAHDQRRNNWQQRVTRTKPGAAMRGIPTRGRFQIALPVAHYNAWRTWLSTIGATQYGYARSALIRAVRDDPRAPPELRDAFAELDTNEHRMSNGKRRRR